MNHHCRRIALVVVLPLAAWLAAVLAAPDSTRDPAAPDSDLQRILGQPDQAGYRTADAGYCLRFPQDHGPHPDFRHEWWYFTGNLQDDQGRRYGYQFTLFRFALNPPAAKGDGGGERNNNGEASAWRSRQLYMGHVALSVPHRQQFYHRERFSRDALGLAGAQAAPFKLWLYDWLIAAVHI